MKQSAVLMVVAAMCATTVSADPARDESILELMRVTTAGDVGAEVVRNLLPMAKAANPQLGEKFWAEFVSEISPDEMVKKLVPVYRRHYSEVDIQEMIRFYKSPVGRKILQLSPQVRQESMRAGQEWAQEVSWRAQQKVAKQMAEQNAISAR